MRKGFFLIPFLFFFLLVNAQESRQVTPVIQTYYTPWNMLYFDESAFYTCTNSPFLFNTYYNPSDNNSQTQTSWNEISITDENGYPTRSWFNCTYGPSTDFYLKLSLEQICPSYNWYGFTSPKVFYIYINYTTNSKCSHTYSSSSPWVNLAVIKRTFYPKLVTGSIYFETTSVTTKTIEYNTTPATINGSSSKGGNGSFTSQWQKMESGSSSWNDIVGATSLSYISGSLVKTTIIRRKDVPAVCGSAMYTNNAVITVLPDVIPGQIGTIQTICYNTTVLLTSITNGSGGTGTYNYQWQSSIDGVNFWDITGATSATYLTSNLTSATYFRRKCTSGVNYDFTNAVLISVFSSLSGGTISASQNICYNNLPSQIGGPAATGGDGTYSYQWESSPDATAWSPVPSATSLNYQPPALTTSSYYRRKVTTGSGCGTNYSNQVSISVYNDLNPGSISPSQTICYNATPGQITGTTPTGGDGTFTYKWQYSLNGTTWLDVALANGPSYQPSNLTTTTYYHRSVTSGSGCGTKTSSSIAITVYGNLTSGSISPSQTICYNAIPAPINVTNPSGGNGSYTYSWESSTNGTNWYPIPLASSSTYQASNLIATTYFHRIVSSGSGCGSQTSSPITVSVYGSLTAGSISSSQTICYNTIPARINGTSPIGGDGSYSYSWESSSDGTNWSNIPLATSLNYQPVNLTSSTYYHRIVTSGSGCGSQISSPVVVTVYSNLSPGTITPSQTICYNSIPAPINGTIPNGGDGTYTYRWESSPNGTSWNSIPLASGSTYQPSNLTATTYYRRTVTSGSSCGSQTSSPVLVSVYGNLTPGSISPAQTICYNAIPTPINGTAPLGGDGSYSYSWESSTDGTSWTNIPLATSPSYQASNLTTTTYYHRIVSSGSGCGSQTSLPVTVSVYSSLTAGSIAASQTICNNTIPSAINGTTPNGGDGTYSYSWESSPNGTSWNTIPLATGSAYQPGNLTTTTYYHRMVTSGSSCGSQTSSPITITVYSNLSPGTITPSQTICYNAIPTPINGTTPIGGDGTYSYSWESSANGTNWNTIPLATSSAYQPSNLTATTYYRRTVTSGSSCGSQTSSPVLVTIYGNLTPGNISPAQTICYNSIPAPINGIAPTGGDGSYSYSWESSTDGTSWTNIPLAAGSSYQAGNLVTPTYYRRTVTSGSGCGSQVSSPLTINVYGNLTVGSISPSQKICYKTIPLKINGTEPSGGDGSYSYKWESSPDSSNWTTLNLATSSAFQPDSLTSTTYYRRTVLSGSSCGSQTSVPISIKVYGNLTPGIISSSQTICNGASPSIIVGTFPSGGDGTYSYKWESSLDGSSWNEIALAANASYQPGQLNSTILLRRVVSSGSGCGNKYSSPVTISVQGTLDPGTISSPQTICYATSAFPFTGTAAAGADGIFNYQWKYSEDNSSWTDIPGANGLNYSPGVLTKTRYFKRTVSTSCGNKETPLLTVVVYDDLNSGEISSSQTICYNSIPTVLSGSMPSGGDGTYTYKWEYSANGSSWIDVPLASGSTFQPGVLTSTTNYKRTVTTGSGCGSKSSSPLVVTVYNQIAPGSIIKSQSICYNIIPDGLTGTNGVGGDGVFTYQWKYSEDGIRWNNLPGEMNPNYQPPALIKNTYFKRQSINACGNAISDSVLIEVKPPVDPGVISSDQTICFSSSPALLIGTYPQGGFSPYSFQWQYSTDKLNWIDISGATDSVYQPGNLNINTYFRRKVNSFSCGDFFTNSIIANILSKPPTPAVTYPSFYCQGENVLLNNNNSALTYQWYDANDKLILTGSQYTIANVQENESLYCRSKNNNGCLSDPQEITIFVDIVKADFSTTVSTIGEGELIKFYNQSVNASSFIWDFSEGEKSTVAEPWHIFNDPGTKTITLIATTSNGCSDTITKADLVVTSPDGITDQISTTYKIYPNPVFESLFIESGTFEKITIAKLYNSIGDLISIIEFSQHAQIDMRNYPPGIYVITIQIDSKSKSFKIVKL